MSIPTFTLNNGVEIPVLGFGVFQTPPERDDRAVRVALETGYRHIDTAAAYGNEREVGEAIRRSGLARDQIFVETKVWITDYGYDATLHAFEKATGKLGVDAARSADPAPGAARRVRADHRRLQGAGEAVRRRQGPRDRRLQLHAAAPRPAVGRDRCGAGGQPDRGAPLLPAVRVARRRRPSTASSTRRGRRSAASRSTATARTAPRSRTR